MRLSSADFFQNQLFRKNIAGIPIIGTSNSLDPDRARRFVGPGWVQPVCIDYQQTTKS